MNAYCDTTMLSRPLNTIDLQRALMPATDECGDHAGAGKRPDTTGKRPSSRQFKTRARRLFLPGEFDTGAAKAAAADNTPVTDPAELQSIIDRYTTEIELSDNTPVRLRPVLPQDKNRLQAGMARMSEYSRYRRFMSQMSRLPDNLLRRLTEIDYNNHFALAALTLTQHPPEGIGVARYIRDEDKPHVAEPAVTIVDDYQGRGLGHQLLERLMTIALEHGVTHFRATLLADNQPMKQLFMQQGATFEYAGYGELIADFGIPVSYPPRTNLVRELARQAYDGAVKSAHNALPYPFNL